jgi:preprotein translocase subunit SecB
MDGDRVEALPPGWLAELVDLRSRRLDEDTWQVTLTVQVTTERGEHFRFSQVVMG